MYSTLLLYVLRTALVMWKISDFFPQWKIKTFKCINLTYVLIVPKYNEHRPWLL